MRRHFPPPLRHQRTVDAVRDAVNFCTPRLGLTAATGAAAVRHHRSLWAFENVKLLPPLIYN